MYHFTVLDAVTIVVYNMNIVLAEDYNTEPMEYVKGVIAFFVSSLVGVTIGMVIGSICSIITKFTSELKGKCNIFSRIF